MGPAPDQMLMEELDKLEEVDLEVSGNRLGDFKSHIFLEIYITNNLLLYIHRYII
jgi:hypothetical protein